MPCPSIPNDTVILGDDSPENNMQGANFMFARGFLEYTRQVPVPPRQESSLAARQRHIRRHNGQGKPCPYEEWRDTIPPYHLNLPAGEGIGRGPLDGRPTGRPYKTAKASSATQIRGTESPEILDPTCLETL